MSQLRNAIIANLGGGTPPTPPEPIDDGKLRFTVNVTNAGTSTSYFSKGSSPSVSDYVIDWGDNITSVNTTNHNYANNGTYQITIQAGASGNFPYIYFENSNTIVSVDSVLPHINIQYFDNMFSGSSLSSICDKFFKNNSQNTSALGIFRNCLNLTQIPADLFQGFTSVTDASSLFSGSSIQSLPTGILDSFVNVTTVDSLCNGCAELTTVPDGLLAKQSKCIGYSAIFQNCVKLKLNKNIFCDEDTEKTTRFAGISNWIYFNNAFNRTSYTNTEQGTAPALWEYTITKSQKGNCFAGAGNSATSLSNYSSIPSAWGGPA